jgi:hypothetical protein
MEAEMLSTTFLAPLLRERKGSPGALCVGPLLHQLLLLLWSALKLFKLLRNGGLVF